MIQPISRVRMDEVLLDHINRFFSVIFPVSPLHQVWRYRQICPMLCRIYIETLLVDEELVDEELVDKVWAAWDAENLTDGSA